jgi:hypothetical protein
MSSSLSRIKDGKRGWSEEGISLIQKRLEKEDSRAKFIDLKGVLEESLCAVGFEKNYMLGSSDCGWSLNTGGWVAYVNLGYGITNNDEITFAINGVLRPLRDLLPLWGILRESFYEN